MSNRTNRRRVEELLKVSRALAVEVEELTARMTTQVEQNRAHLHLNHGQLPALGQHQIRRQFRLGFPYAAKLHLPADGLGSRLAPLQRAAAQLGKTPHAEWLEQVGSDYFIVFGFRTAGEMEALRAWLLDQGWGDLLS
jgi:hypothetical protein